MIFDLSLGSLRGICKLSGLIATVKGVVAVESTCKQRKLLVLFPCRNSCQIWKIIYASVRTVGT